MNFVKNCIDSDLKKFIRKNQKDLSIKLQKTGNLILRYDFSFYIAADFLNYIDVTKSIIRRTNRNVSQI